MTDNPELPAHLLRAQQMRRLIAESPGGRLIGHRWEDDPIVPLKVYIDPDVDTEGSRVEARLLRAVEEMIDLPVAQWAPFDDDEMERRIAVPLIVAELLEWYAGDEAHFFTVERLPGMVFPPKES